MLKACVKVLSVCKETTKLWEQEKVLTLPLVVERIYTMLHEIDNMYLEEDVDDQVLLFADILGGKLRERFRFLSLF